MIHQCLRLTERDPVWPGDVVRDERRSIGAVQSALLNSSRLAPVRPEHETTEQETTRDQQSVRMLLPVSKRLQTQTLTFAEDQRRWSVDSVNRR